MYIKFLAMRNMGWRYLSGMDVRHIGGRLVICIAAVLVSKGRAGFSVDYRQLARSVFHIRNTKISSECCFIKCVGSFT
jgi:hypothetical protein